MYNFILSLKHSKPEEEFFTFWRSNSKGYTFYLNASGYYSSDPENKELEKQYPNDDNMFIGQDLLYILEKKDVLEYGAPVTGVLNNERNREILKIYYEKRTLKRR